MPNAVLPWICNRQFVGLQNDRNKNVKKIKYLIIIIIILIVITIIIINKAFRSTTMTWKLLIQTFSDTVTDKQKFLLSLFTLRYYGPNVFISRKIHHFMTNLKIWNLWDKIFKDKKRLLVASSLQLSMLCKLPIDNTQLTVCQQFLFHLFACKTKEEIKVK